MPTSSCSFCHLSSLTLRQEMTGIAHAVDFGRIFGRYLFCIARPMDDSHLNSKFERIDDRFQQVDNRFEQVDHRLEQVDRRFDQVDATLTRLEELIKSEGRITRLHFDVVAEDMKSQVTVTAEG